MINLFLMWNFTNVNVSIVFDPMCEEFLPCKINIYYIDHCQQHNR